MSLALGSSDGSSGRGGELAGDVLVRAEMLLGGLDRQTTVQVLAETELQLARVVPLRQRLGHALTSFTRVGDDLVHQFPEAGQGCFARLGEPREPGPRSPQHRGSRAASMPGEPVATGVNIRFARRSQSCQTLYVGPPFGRGSTLPP